jgi:hypothetical protein
MRRPTLLIVALVVLDLAWIFPIRAEIGPCTQGNYDLICGDGIGAARAIAKTISPSKRLAFAWRLADKLPTTVPEVGDPNLENMIVRLWDGAVLAKSSGSYWDLGSKIAKAYLMTAWSPDSRLLVKVEQRVESVSAEIFAFAENDTVIGPFDLVNVIEPIVQAKTNGTKEVGKSSLVIDAHPSMTLDDSGLMRAAVKMRMQDAAAYGQTYDVTVQVTRKADSLDASVTSITPRTGASISIIVH